LHEHIAKLAELSIPFYYVLAIFLPVVIMAIIYRYLCIRKIIKDKSFSLRIFSTLMIAIFSLLYIETHLILVLMGFEFVPYGIDNILGAFVFAFSYLLIDSYMKFYFSFHQKDKSVKMLRTYLQITFGLTVFFLLLSNFFLGGWVADFLVSLFGIFSILFFIALFYSVNFLINKLDKYSRINLYWFRYLLISIIIISIIDTILDILNLPTVLNIFYIPFSILGIYIVWMFMKYVVYAESLD
jgi:hypothetical protein